MKTYVTFGQVHTHSINGKTLDKDSVAVIERDTEQEGRSAAFEYFGKKFFTTYADTPPKMEYFPRGFIGID